MKLKVVLIDIGSKIWRNRWLFFIFIAFWLTGVFYFRIFEDISNIDQLLLMSVGLVTPTSTGLYGSIYLFLWPVFIETIIFGFLVNALLERYNPVLTAQKLAKNRAKHTIIIGYQHLGIRMVTYLRNKHRPYVLIDNNQNNVNALIEAGEPVIIGDASDSAILQLANIKKAKEIFILVNNVRASILICEKTREINKKCKIYVRIYEQDFSDYLSSPPINAKVFSTSGWALEAIKKWTLESEEGVIVVGRDHLAEKVINHISTTESRKIWAMDPKLDEDLIHYLRNLEVLRNTIERIESFTNYIDMEKISQIFFCWKEDFEASTAVYLAQRLHVTFPHLKIYVRVFDDELANILSKIGVTTFSTTQFAFSRLQQEVEKTSSICE